ncbi:MAG: MFS transporter [Akkermansiaceae bacterium]|nr:MFS transporter [Akkermansiaceae bacterium]
MNQTPETPPSETSLNDVKQLGLWASIASLSYVFWIVGGMEMIERLAFYGVRSVASIYVTRGASDGGLGETMASFGTLLFFWSLIQSGGSIFTGGLSDRYGYKETIFASTLIKCFGYLVMAWFPSYWGFFGGALFLALGTAIFKPGIQGTLIRSCNRRNSSVAWGVFYQTVNIGAWIGPLIAMRMRQFEWSYVFYANAAFICLNLLLLLTYKEPGKKERLERRAQVKAGHVIENSLFRESLRELKKPHLHFYLLIFSLWWFMFPMIWDVLPKYVEDWVDTGVIVRTLFGEDGTRSSVIHFLLGMKEGGMTIEPEGIVNINAGMIMFTCFIFAGLSARMRATNSLLVGTILVVVALTLFGLFNLAWMCVAAMAVFSVGEMLASPKFSEFLGNIAPPDKKAMWIGFSQAPILIGATIEAKVGPQLYHMWSDKDVLARQLLVERGVDPAGVTLQALPAGEAFHKLVAVTGEAPETLTRLLYETHHIGATWAFFAAVGLVSAALIFIYGKWIRQLARQEQPTRD